MVRVGVMNDVDVVDGGTVRIHVVRKNLQRPVERRARSAGIATFVDDVGSGQVVLSGCVIAVDQVPNDGSALLPAEQVLQFLLVQGRVARPSFFLLFFVRWPAGAAAGVFAAIAVPEVGGRRNGVVQRQMPAGVHPRQRFAIHGDQGADDLEQRGFDGVGSVGGGLVGDFGIEESACQVQRRRLGGRIAEGGRRRLLLNMLQCLAQVQLPFLLVVGARVRLDEELVQPLWLVGVDGGRNGGGVIVVALPLLFLLRLRLGWLLA
mmetsp:Transcript_22502/g.63770  ORF Transcript_22502/g.63770 Transcript_22502/m.63770 type:complete len:263 (+) Transcript_22502:1658-2446(+)